MVGSKLTKSLTLKFNKFSFQMSVEDHFKIRDKEVDGTMTVRKLNGLRRDSEIIFVAPKKVDLDESSEGLDRFDGRGMTRLGGETHLGIFDRPGMCTYEGF